MSIPIDLYEHPKVKAALSAVSDVLTAWAEHEQGSLCDSPFSLDGKGERVRWGDVVKLVMSPGWPTIDLGERLASLLLRADKDWCWGVAAEVDRLPGEPLRDYFARVDAEAIAAAKKAE